MGFGQGLSGLNAASQELDIIGNNIANSGTVGFKAASATFSDVYASSKVGLGVQVASVNQRFTVGTVSGTGGQFDMAIDGAKGMFRMQDQSGNIMYTRNGQFFADKDNYIVNAQGQRLTGYAVSGTDLVPIKVPVGNIDPKATNSVTTKANFDANAKVVPLTNVTGVPGVTEVLETIGTVVLTDATTSTATPYYYTIAADGTYSWVTSATDTTAGPAPDPTETYATGDVAAPQSVTFSVGAPPQPVFTGSDTAFDITGGNIAYVAYVAPVAEVPAVIAIPFDITNPNSYTHSLPMSVYDSLGNAHQFIQYYIKRPGVGNESVWDINYRIDGQALTAPDGPVDGATQMRFDSTGRLLGSNAGAGVTFNMASPGGTASPAAPMSLALNYTNSTQFGGAFSPNFIQDGYATGEYAGMSIASDGAIVANYTNDQTQSMGYVVLADFNNLQGLQPIGGNAWVEAGASGQPILGRPGTNSLATIKGQAVEESNVDMSQELVKMIIAQRTYQANAQTIKTQDQVLQTLITMR